MHSGQLLESSCYTCHWDVEEVSMGTYIIREAYEKIQQVKKEQDQVRQGQEKIHSRESVIVERRGLDPKKKASSD